MQKSVEEIVELWTHVSVRTAFEQLRQGDECGSAVDYFYELKRASGSATRLKRVSNPAGDRFGR